MTGWARYEPLPSHYITRHLAWKARREATGSAAGTAAYKAWLADRAKRKASRVARRMNRRK